MHEMRKRELVHVTSHHHGNRVLLADADVNLQVAIARNVLGRTRTCDITPPQETGTVNGR